MIQLHVSEVDVDDGLKHRGDSTAGGTDSTHRRLSCAGVSRIRRKIKPKDYKERQCLQFTSNETDLRHK